MKKGKYDHKSKMISSLKKDENNGIIVYCAVKNKHETCLIGNHILPADLFVLKFNRDIIYIFELPA